MPKATSRRLEGSLRAGSNNLSETAGNDSLEAGIPIRGGDLPARPAEHIDSLRTSENLRSS